MSLHGRPDARELVEAVRELLEQQVLLEGVPPGDFAVRVAVNVLRTVERELAATPADDERSRARLAALGFADDASLAAALRRGDVAPDRLPAVRAAVLADVEDRLRVADPRYLRP